MSKSITLQMAVLPGRRLEITSAELPESGTVRVIVVLPDVPQPRSILKFLESLPRGPRSAASWDAIEQRLQEERDGWDR